MKLAHIIYAITSALPSVVFADSTIQLPERLGPAAVLEFEMRFRGDSCIPEALNCYPDAKGIPFEETAHIISMSGQLWTPSSISADFRRRAISLSEKDEKKGIIVVLKTERCASKEARFCSVTTAVLDRQSTPLLGQFVIYGVQLKPRDGDIPPGSRVIEVGVDSWKNDAAREYGFIQGPGATIVFLNPRDGSKIAKTDALEMHLYEKELIANKGRTPELEKLLSTVLEKLAIKNG